WIPLDLRHADRGVVALERVVVVVRVLEGLAQRRGAVEADNAVARKRRKLLETRHAEEMELRVALADLGDCFKALENLAGLERHHASQRNVPIPDVLQNAHRMPVGARAPAL